MGMMKQYLIEKTSELAGILDIPEQDFYKDIILSNLAHCYAQYRLKQGQKITDTREEIKKAILTRIDEVVGVIQDLLMNCQGGYVSCPDCPFSFLCEKSTQYM